MGKSVRAFIKQVKELNAEKSKEKTDYKKLSKKLKLFGEIRWVD